jgi:hypothetical protein
MPPSPLSFAAGSTGSLTLSAKLTESDTSAPVAGAAVAFFVDGVTAGTSISDLSGTALLTLDPSQLPVGTHAVHAVAARQLVDDESIERSISAVYSLDVTASPYNAEVQAPIRADGTSVFHVNRGTVPVKFTLSYNGAPTCALPPATLSVTRVSGNAPGRVNESDYLLRPDDSSSFRIESCQYVYNLGTTALGAGTYVVSISVGSTIVGRATFGMQ